MNEKAQQLLDASIDLFASEGFWNTPTARIAKHAGVATGTLFNYFPSKDALIDAVYLHLKQKWIQHIMVGYPANEDVRHCLGHIWFRHIDWGVRYPSYYALKQQLALSDLLSAETLNRQAEELSVVSNLIQRGFDAGLFKPISTELFTNLILAELDATVRYALTHDLRDMALAQLIATSFDIFWDGVAR
jgi:AcrR family transcriptional regulator